MKNKQPTGIEEIEELKRKIDSEVFKGCYYVSELDEQDIIDLITTARREAVEEFAKSLVEGSDSSMWLEIKVKDIMEYVADFNSKEKPQ